MEEQISKDKAKQAAEEIVVEERQIFKEAIRIECQYHNNKSNKEKKHHKDEKLSSIDRLEEMKLAVESVKSELKTLRDAMAQEKLDNRELKDEHNTLLSTVSQLEADLVLIGNHLDEALETASQPTYVFEMERYGTRARL